jgi:hypothetical protein
MKRENSWSDPKAAPDCHRASTGHNPSQEGESEKQRNSSHSDDYELHTANEVTVALYVLCMVVLICYGDLRSIVEPMLGAFRHGQAQTG